MVPRWQGRQHEQSALSQHGKVGAVCIGTSPEKAIKFYKKTMDILKLETVYQLYMY